MKIMEDDGEVIDIVAIYWCAEKTLFLGIPKDFGGLTAINSNKVKIIDPKINYRAVYFKNRMHGIYHWALIEEDLLDEVIDHDPKSFNRFIEILKSEGVLSEDFI
ncbi:hypothetical protein [Commensalibacter nepenthis]|uniref:Uncharacterized protein n=1 Tax=Commensalibacter nepenthis TaxID=3043872 RepID=A0ABT6Q4E4_9PROT|nr:hypothetical protein [Commensalibacter sp. TBRC 10068]MDI2111770.1 hypothetical protein [Commensalibacter sp. TBRC 10068]